MSEEKVRLPRPTSSESTMLPLIVEIVSKPSTCNPTQFVIERLPAIADSDPNEPVTPIGVKELDEIANMPPTDRRVGKLK